MADNKDATINLFGGSFALPKEYQAATFTALGPMDGSAGLSAGPTLAKAVSHQIRRTLTLSATPLPGVDLPPEGLAHGLNEAKNLTKGVVKEVEDLTVDGRPAKKALLRHKQGPTPVVSAVLVTAVPGYVWIVIHSCLDDPAAVKAMRSEFDSFVASIGLGKS